MRTRALLLALAAPLALAACGNDTPLPTPSRDMAPAAAAYSVVPVIDHGLQVKRPDWEKYDCTVSNSEGDLPKLVVTKVIQDVSGEIDKGGTFRVEMPCTGTIRSMNPMSVGQKISSITTTLEAIKITDKGPETCRYHLVDRDIVFSEPLFTSNKRFAGGCGGSY